MVLLALGSVYAHSSNPGNNPPPQSGWYCPIILVRRFVWASMKAIDSPELHEIAETIAQKLKVIVENA
jgi:hypothetical protein